MSASMLEQLSWVHEKKSAQFHNILNKLIYLFIYGPTTINNLI